MPVLVTCKFDKDLINNKHAREETLFSQYTGSLWEIFPVLNGDDPIRLEFELIWDFTPVLDTCKFGEDPIKDDWEKVETPFPHYKSMGAFGCHDNHSQRQFWSNLPQNLM